MFFQIYLPAFEKFYIFATSQYHHGLFFGGCHGCWDQNRERVRPASRRFIIKRSAFPTFFVYFISRFFSE